MEKNKEPVLIVDGDIVNFVIGRVTEDVTDFGDQVCKSFDKEAIVRLLDIAIDDIGTKCGYSRENIIFSISCEKNYRKEHFPTYKSNRKTVVKPQGLAWLRQYLKDNADKYNLLLIENLEADDCMGIFGTSGDGNISIHSEDKDLFTIPVRQWDFKKNKFITPTPLESIRFLYTQVLTGDTVDGYKGCPRIGKVKAEAALRDCSNELEMLQACYVRYHKVYGTGAEEELLMQIGQARILHQIDYIALVNFNETYDPFKILGVESELLNEWSDKYHEELAEAKKKPKKRKVVKDAI
jgi:DNA polymerase-1